MANKQKGDVSFEADGNRYTLRYDVNALCELEGELDDMAAALAALMKGGGKRRITMLRTVFRAGLTGSHGSLTKQEAGSIMSAVGLERAFGLVGEAVMLAFPDGEGGSTGNAPLPGAAKHGTGTASSPAG